MKQLLKANRLLETGKLLETEQLLKANRLMKQPAVQFKVEAAFMRWSRSAPAEVRFKGVLEPCF